MTRRSSHPCREWEGPSSPRCSQKPRMPCSDATTPPCAVSQESRRSPRGPERAASSSDDRPATTASPTPSTIGPVSPFSTIRAAAPNTPNSEAEVKAMVQSAVIGRRPPPQRRLCHAQIRRRLQPVLSRSKTRLINGGESHQISIALTPGASRRRCDGRSQCANSSHSRRLGERLMSTLCHPSRFGPDTGGAHRKAGVGSSRGCAMILFSERRLRALPVDLSRSSRPKAKIRPRAITLRRLERESGSLVRV